MKPFDLEKALAGEPVVTRNGFKVLEIYRFKKYNKKDNIAVVIEREHKYHNIRYYDYTGTEISLHNPSEWDLLMYQEKIDKFANLYKDKLGNVTIDDTLFDTRYLAQKNIRNKEVFFKTIQIKIK